MLELGRSTVKGTEISMAELKSVRGMVRSKVTSISTIKLKFQSDLSNTQILLSGFSVVKTLLFLADVAVAGC